MKWFLPALVLLLTCLFPQPVHGWGRVGHRFLTAAAIQQLPTPLRTYFQLNAGNLTNNAAVEPAGTHYIDIDYYPEFHAGNFPRDFDVLVAQYGSNVVNAYGTGPWLAVRHYETLRARFATAQTSTDWSSLLLTAAVLAHFIEDLHNPMHLTTNYNGQYTGQTGLHSRYETTMVEYQLSVGGLMLSNRPTDCIHHPSMRDAIFDGIDQVFPHNATILRADLLSVGSTNYNQSLWDNGCSGFTPWTMQRAAGMVASAWYSAWREAGFPALPGVISSGQLNLGSARIDAATIELSFHGDAGQLLHLERSADMVTWSPFLLVTNLDGRMPLRLPVQENAPRTFYRALLPGH